MYVYIIYIYIYIDRYVDPSIHAYVYIYTYIYIHMFEPIPQEAALLVGCHSPLLRLSSVAFGASVGYAAAALGAAARQALGQGASGSGPDLCRTNHAAVSRN